MTRQINPTCGGSCPTKLPAELPTVELCTGEVVCTWCSKWLAECRERHADVLRVMQMPSKTARRFFVDSQGVAKGETYKARLEAEIFRQWDARYKKQA